jgi:hypothetical protein
LANHLAPAALVDMPSTAIKNIVYDASAKRLLVIFVTGRKYIYEDVPPDVHAAFQSAPSKGRFFNAEIRDRYTCHEIRRRA